MAVSRPGSFFPTGPENFKAGVPEAGMGDGRIQKGDESQMPKDTGTQYIAGLRSNLLSLPK